MDAENMREFKFRVQYELKDGSRVWLYSPTDVSNSHIFDLKNAGHRNRVTDVPEIVDGKRTGNDLVAAIVEESFGQWTGVKDKNGKEIYEGDVVQCKHYVACERWWSRIEEIPIIALEVEKQRNDFSVVKSIVRFDDGYFQIEYPVTLKDIGRQLRLERGKGNNCDVESKWWDFEVIGTIHDAPRTQIGEGE